MARFAYLTPFPFVEARGGMRMRFQQLHQALRAEGHEVILHHREQADWLRMIAASPAGLGQSLYMRLQRPIHLTSAAEYAYLHDWLNSQNIDVLIVTHFFYSDLIPWAKRLSLPVIIDTHNVESAWQMMRAHRRSPLAHSAVWLSEALYFRSAWRIWTISQQDERVYRRRYQLSSVRYIPFAVPVPELYSPIASDRPEVLFVGIFSYQPNAVAGQFLLERVLPALQRLVPDVRLVLAGRNPPQAWLEHYAHNPAVTITGEVADLSDYYRRAAVVVAPISLGGGVKTKVLEAMSFAKALVASPQASAGIAMQADSHYLRAAYRPSAFADSIAQVLHNPALQAQLGSAARDFIQHQHSSGAVQHYMRHALDKD